MLVKYSDLKYNRVTLKEFAAFLLALALVVFVCGLALDRSAFQPPPNLPSPDLEFFEIALRPPGSIGAVFNALANTKPRILWNGAVI